MGARGAEGAQMWRRRAREIPPKAGISRVIYDKILIYIPTTKLLHLGQEQSVHTLKNLRRSVARASFLNHHCDKMKHL